MNKIKNSNHGDEYPYGHLIYAISSIMFTVIIILDTIYNEYTKDFAAFIPNLFQWIFFAIFLIISLMLIYLSHSIIFQEEYEKPTLITNGILNHVRNPMYLGILLIYPAFLCLSLSIFGFLFWIILIFVYNFKIVAYEENVLEELFGDDFRKYKEKVPKWIPKIKKGNLDS